MRTSSPWGARMIPLQEALEIVKVWLEEPFDGGRHLARIRQIDEGTSPGGGKAGGGCIG